MAEYADRVYETTETAGTTRPFELKGTVTGFQTFVSGIGDGNSCDYLVTDGTNWQVNRGSVSDSSPDTLSEDSIYASSNSGDPVDFPEGQKDIVQVLAADKIIDLINHLASTENPHSVTKAQVGLGSVTDDVQLKKASNLSDLDSASTARENLGVKIGVDVQAYIKHNFDGDGEPGADDDSSEGYSVGSVWIDTSADPREAYRCVDDTEGDAKWVNTSLEIGEIGTLAEQDKNNVDITGGSVKGIDDLKIEDGGTGASSADDARQNLGIGGVSFDVYIPDPLRASVEAATGGMCTVLYDDFDLPNYMRIIPAMNAGDLIDGKSGLHPAFLYNGDRIPETFIGMYQAGKVDKGGTNRAVSYPGIEPWVSIDFDDARSRCSEKGSGWHLMTNWEWAAVALWIAHNGWQPRGNTDHGRAHDAVYETGVRQDGDSYEPGDSSGTGNILCGTGPRAWRHDQTAAGIADLVGNVWEWNDLLKIEDGRVYMADDNEYDLSESSWSDTGHDISLSDPWSDYDPSHTSDLLELALIVPVSESDSLNGRLYVNDEDERMARRGGGRSSAGGAGPAALYLDFTRSGARSDFGFRPAFILKP